MSESLITTVYEIQCDLYGASSNWIESLCNGADRLGAEDVESWANPAYAGIRAKTDDFDTAKKIDAYFRRTAPLATWRYLQQEGLGND